jgi:uncharacterized protein (TIGR03067 family)
MTRFTLFGAAMLALCGFATADDKKDVPKELAPFQGTWKVLKATRGTEEAPKEAIESLSFVFEGSKVTIGEKGRSKPGTFAVRGAKEPAEIDLTSDEGKKVLGIYKFDKDGKLTICFVKDGDGTRPKGFDATDAAVMVLEKAKK